jgi:hypothetical protein
VLLESMSSIYQSFLLLKTTICGYICLKYSLDKCGESSTMQCNAFGNKQSFRFTKKWKR